MKTLTQLAHQQVCWQSFYSDYQHVLTSHYPGVNLQSFYRQWGHLTFEESLTIQKLLLLGLPWSYLAQESFFFHSPFYVNSNVLIPRWESEYLVEKAIAFLASLDGDRATVFDVGTGSGNLLLSLAQSVSAKKLIAMGVDVSLAALEVAKWNAFRLAYSMSPHHTLNWYQSDRLSIFGSDYAGVADLIISNPPYIKSVLGRLHVHEQTDRYEPHLALYLEDKEYSNWFEVLFSQVSKVLAPHGLFLMEGHEHELEHLSLLLPQFNLKGVISYDYNQRPRYLEVQQQQ